MFPVRSLPSALRTLLYGSAFVWLLSPAARAQDRANDERQTPTPAYIAVVDGAATVERDGQSQQAVMNAPFVPGDHLRTTTGRVEVLFPDGTALDVDQYSAVDLQSPTLIRLTAGRLMLVVAGANDPAAAVRYQVDTPAGSAQMGGAGEYRVAVLNGRTGLETELAVLRGVATLSTERGAMAVRAGERTVSREGEAPSFAQAFNSARFDAFDRWSAEQQNARTGATSSQYLPQGMQMYGGTFDRYGSWQYNAPYGYVWYPTVAPDWRPYYYGQWAAYDPWGWTWIGVDRWAWPTHHFGRWGFAHSRWFWIPGRIWGPAWVTWASAPGFVSWCPLGFDGRPVFALSLGFGNFWDGWTVVPRHSFGHFARIDRFAVGPHRMPFGATEFVSHRTAPVAVPRTARRADVVDPRSPVGSHQSGVDLRRTEMERRTPAVAVPRSAPTTRGLTTTEPRLAAADARFPTNEGFKQPLSHQPSPVTSRQSPIDGRQAIPRAPTYDRRPTNDPQPSTATPRSYSPGGIPVRGYPPATMPHANPAPEPRTAPTYAPPAAVPRYSAPPPPSSQGERPSAPPPSRVDRPSGPPPSHAPATATPREAGPAPQGQGAPAPRAGGSPSHSGGGSHQGRSGRGQ